MVWLNTAKKVILFTLSFIVLLLPFNAASTEKADQKLLLEKPAVHVSAVTPPPSASVTPTTVQQNLVKFPDKGIPVLMYHSISTEPGNTLCVPEKQFSEEMDWLKSQGYHSITVDQFYEALANGGQVPEKPVLITFDDGYKDGYTAAWPIMKQYGFVGTFFIITNAIVPSRIDWDQLKDLVKNGNSIGSHTVHHLDMPTLKDSQQESEIADSKKVLEDGLEIKINSFCYPSGKSNQTTQKLLTKCGYKVAFTTDSGRAHLGDNPLKITRLRISGGMTLSSFKALLP